MATHNNYGLTLYFLGFYNVYYQFFHATDFVHNRDYYGITG